MQREVDKEITYGQSTAADLKYDKINATRAIGIAVGSSGTIVKSTMKKLKNLGIAKHAKSLQMIAMNYSAEIWRTHESRNTAD